MKYTYKINYIAPQQTIIKDCDRPIDWSTLNVDGLYQINTPKGRMTINLRHVTSIEEIIKEDE